MSRISNEIVSDGKSLEFAALRIVSGKDVWFERMCLVRVVDGASINSLRMEEIAVMSGF